MDGASRPADPFSGSPGFLLYRLGRDVGQQIDQHLVPFGLRARHLRVLALLGEAELSQSELSAISGLDRTTMVAVIDHLEDASLVQRARSATDRRRQLVHRTPAGGRTLHEASAVLAEAERSYLAGLSAEESAQLHRLLARLYVAHDPSCVVDDDGRVVRL